MSTATKIKLGVLTLVLLLLGGKLLGEGVGRWYDGHEKGVINLPCAAKQRHNTVASANASYRFGYRMSQIQNGCRLVLPHAMTGCVVVAASSSGVLVSIAANDGDVVIDGSTLIKLRDGGVESFSLRIVDIDGDFIEIKIVLTHGSEAYEILVR